MIYICTTAGQNACFIVLFSLQVGKLVESTTFRIREKGQMKYIISIIWIFYIQLKKVKEHVRHVLRNV